MNERKEYISAAGTAKLIRTALKREFPGQKFYVNTSTYAGGASIDVKWIDGPTEKDVNAVVGPYAGKGFDGMIDLSYYYSAYLMPDGSVFGRVTGGTYGSGGSNPPVELEEAPPPEARRVSFGAGYVSATRACSRELLEAVAAEVKAEYNFDFVPNIVDSTWFAGRKERGPSAWFEIDYTGDNEWKCRLYSDGLREASRYEKSEAKSSGNGPVSETTVVRDRDWVWVTFPSKPGDDIRAALKDLGGRWSRKRAAWYFKNGSDSPEATLVGLTA